MDTRELGDRLGQKRMADALHVGVTAVNNAIHRGWLPATWYFVIDALCTEDGFACPKDLFRFKVPDPVPQGVDGTGSGQEAAE